MQPYEIQGLSLFLKRCKLKHLKKEICLKNEQSYVNEKKENECTKQKISVLPRFFKNVDAKITITELKMSIISSIVHNNKPDTSKTIVHSGKRWHLFSTPRGTPFFWLKHLCAAEEGMVSRVLSLKQGRSRLLNRVYNFTIQQPLQQGVFFLPEAFKRLFEGWR